MARVTPMSIEKIRSIERGMFWIERVTIFLQVLFLDIPWCFHSASALFVCTNSIYLSLFAERLRIRPYPHDADEWYYLERFAFFCLACWYAFPAYCSYYWYVAIANLIISNVIYVYEIICLEPKQGKKVQMNSNHASTTRGPNPKETDEDEELKKGKAKIDNEPPKEKLEDNQALNEADGKCDEELLATSEDLNGHGNGSWEEVKMENVEHEVNHEEEGAQIEDNLEGEKVSCHEEEPKKAEDIIDAELLETDEISDASEESWEDVEKKDEEAAIDLEHEHEVNHEEEGAQIEDNLEGEKVSFHEEEAKKAEDIIDAELLENDEISDASSEESWEDVEKKDEETAIDLEHEHEHEVNHGKEGAQIEDNLEGEKVSCHEEEAKKAEDIVDAELLENDEISDASEESWWKDVEKKYEEADSDDIERETAWLLFEAKLSAEVKSKILKSFQHDPKGLQWEEEKELIAKITAAFGCSTDKIVEATESLQEMNHKLEQEKKSLSAKLEAATQSLEHYQANQKYFEEERSEWNEEREFYTVQFETCRRTIESIKGNANNQENQSKWDKERDDLTAKLAATDSWFQYYMHHYYDLSAKLSTASSSAEYYQARYNDTEERCRKLRDENLDLSAKLCAETSSAIYFRDLMHEFEKRCHRMEEDKTNLNSKLCTEQASAEFYRRCLRDFGLDLMDLEYLG